MIFHELRRDLFTSNHVRGLLRLYAAALILSPAALAVLALVLVGEEVSPAAALGAILLGLVLALAGARFPGRRLAQRIVGPMGLLVRAAREIQEGRFGSAVDLNEFREAPLEFKLLGMAFNRMAETIKDHIARLERASITDPLTGLRNRRFLVTEGPRLLHIALRSGSKFSCLMIDIDHFKNVNDQHGHLMGDRFLQHITERISQSIRGSDLLARAGGEEFVVLAPNSGNEEARLLAERIRQAVAQNPYEAQGVHLGNTVSVGVAEYSLEPRFGSNIFEDMLERADRALYQAKEQGRNRVALWEDGDVGPDI